MSLNEMSEFAGEDFQKIQRLETLLGQAKALNDEIEEIKAHLKERAGNADLILLSATGQKIASIKWSTRESFSRAGLVAASVPVELIEACAKVSQVQTVRIH